MVTGVWRVDHHVMARDNGDVVNGTAVVEEDKVAGLVLGVWHVSALVVVVLGGGDSSDLLVRALVDGVLRQTRAVEAYGVGARLNALRLASPTSTFLRIH
mgnify:CR=1 FL=1